MDQLQSPIRHYDRRGMTMVEMLISIAMFAVVMAVVFGFLTRSRASYMDMSQRVEYMQAVRATLDLMSREIRSVGCDPASAGFNKIAIADAGHLQCRMDLDGDGAIEVVEPAEDVTYQHVPALQEVIRNSGFGAQTILRNVTAFNLNYFDATGNPLGPVPLSAANRDLVRFIEIDIVGESDRAEQVNYTTRIHIRND